MLRFGTHHVIIRLQSMLQEVGLYRYNGNYKFPQFQAIRTMLMISSSLLPIMFPSSVLPYRSPVNRCHRGLVAPVCDAPRCWRANLLVGTRFHSSLAVDMDTNATNIENTIIHGQMSPLPVQGVIEKPVYSTPTFQSHTESTFATHVLIAAEDAPISVVDVVHNVLSSIHRTEDKTELSAIDLIRLGSVWYLSSSDVAKHGTYNPSSGVKPLRLTSPYDVVEGSKSLIMLSAGDYLRIHHNPRRFRMVNDYDWSKCIDNEKYSNQFSSDTVSGKSNTGRERVPVIVAADSIKGWIVLNKPAGIPVHMTVDNALENVASCLEVAMLSQRAIIQSNTVSFEDDHDVYVATPQRLDQNTSGLLVVATKKIFAAYFAQLLRYKTAELLIHHDNATSTSSTNIGGINKLYRCLVCVMPTNLNANWSVATAEQELLSYVTEQKVMRHYLEPSIRAPKNFVSERPLPKDDDDSCSSSSNNEWPEALLKIRKVSRVYKVSGNETAVKLARSLFRSTIGTDPECSKPDTCEGVMELEIELLTGRTHQIRGQLAACNFPLVGDIQYGGAKELHNVTKNSLVMERLALQCCALEFIDPDVGITKPRRDGTFEYQLKRSERWNSFSISTAWWTQYLNEYEVEIDAVQGPLHSTEKEQESRTILNDNKLSTTEKQANPNLLPPRVSLSRGANKYVLIRAVHPALPTQEEWFVKSATKSECGGSYHGRFKIVYI